MKTVHVIHCFHRRFAVDSLAQATKAIEVLSKLRRIEYTSANSNSDRGHYEYTNDDAEIELSMELNQKVYSPPKHLALPRPKRGAKRCLCNHSDVSPGETCVSCGLSYNP